MTQTEGWLKVLATGADLRELNPFRNVYFQRAEIRNHYARWRTLFCLVNKQAPSIFDFQEMIYAELSIVDNKSQSLLAFNAILMAVYVFALSGDRIGDVPIDDRVLEAGALLLFLSSLFCLSCVWLIWLPMKSAAEIGNAIDQVNARLADLPIWDSVSEEDAANGTVFDRIVRLYRARNWRTLRLRVAWWLAVIGLVLGAVSALRAVDQGARTSGPTADLIEEQSVGHVDGTSATEAPKQCTRLFLRSCSRRW